MTLTLDGLRLWNAQEAEVTGSGEVQVFSSPMDESDEAILASFEQREERVLVGRATSNRLTGEAGYPSDPLGALAQWTREFDTLCNTSQGDGWLLEDTQRGDSVTCIVPSLSWMRNLERAPHEVRWQLRLRRAEGLMPDDPRNPSSGSVSSESVLGSVGMGKETEVRMQKQIQMQDFLVALATSPDENASITDRGTIRTIDVTGEQFGTQSELNNFESTIRGLLGQDTIIGYDSAFPGDTYAGMLEEFGGTREAGDTRRASYALSFVQGSVLS